MALTNAERQQRHRERLKAKLASADSSRDRTWRDVKLVHDELISLAKREPGTIDGGTVAVCARYLELLFDPGHADETAERQLRSIRDRLRTADKQRREERRRERELVKASRR
jgi:hypothetical protein